MKSICFVAEYMLCGGTEKSLISLLQSLDRTKYDITLLLMKKKGDLLSQIPSDVNIEEIEFPEDEEYDLIHGRTAALKEALKSGHFIKAAKKALRAVKMQRETCDGAARRLWYYENISKKVKEYPKEFDVVIDYMGYGLFNTFYAARKVKGKTKISWVHFEPNDAIPDFGSFENLLKEFDHIMCVSENSKKQVIKMIPSLENKCETFYNIVNRKEIYAQAGLENIEENEDEISILSVGRLDYQKGFDIAIGSINKLYEEGYPVKLKIIGEGWQREYLQEIIDSKASTKKCVELLGLKLNPYPYFKACDIYIQPSRHEGYGITVAEARAFNKPILATDFAGAKEQLTDGKTGIIVSCDEDSIYEGLKRLLDDKNLREQLSYNLSKEFVEKPVQVERLEEIIENS